MLLSEIKGTETVITLIDNNIIFKKENQMVKIKNECLRYLKLISYNGYPKEVCTVLFGDKPSNSSPCIVEAIQIPNLVKIRDAFAISKSDYKRTIKKSNYSPIGFYHSHPDCSITYLSETDEKNIFKSNLVWLVGAFTKNDSKSFKISGYLPIKDRVIPLTIKIN